MRIWFPLLAAPILALADQGIAYAAAGWACAHQNGVALHAIHAVFLAACAAGAVMALGMWRESRAGAGDERQHVRHFLSGVGVASATLATIVIAAMWMPSWFVPACFN